MFNSRTASRLASALWALTALGACAGDPAPPLPSPGPAGAYAQGWATAHADAANTDYSPVEGARDLTLAWRRDLGGMINLGPTSDSSGRVYVTTAATRGCRLHALDARTGETVWCSEALNRLAVTSSPLIDRAGRIFVADSDAMFAFDRDGKILWRTPIVGAPLSAQFSPSGHLIFTTLVGRIYVLRRDTGEVVTPVVELIPGATFDASKGAMACMRGTPECPSANTLAVDLKTGRIFLTFWSPGAPAAGVRAMQLNEGAAPSLTPLWTNEALPGGSAASPDLSADGSRLYLTDNSGGLHALDAATGRTIWSHDLGYPAGGSASTSPSGLILPAGGGRGMVAAYQDAGDRALDVWRREDLINRGIPTQAAGHIAYVVVSKTRQVNELLVLDTRTGATLDREALPGETLFTVGTTVGPDGTVYVPAIRGQLFAFRPATSR